MTAVQPKPGQVWRRVKGQQIGKLVRVIYAHWTGVEWKAIDGGGHGSLLTADWHSRYEFVKEAEDA